MSKKEKIILFLGSADTEVVTTKLRVTGTLYKRKMLDSSVENWKTILEYFDNYHVTSVIVKLTNTTFDILCGEEHKELVDVLLRKISQVPHLCMSHESLLTGNRASSSESKEQSLDSELEDHYGYMFEPPEEKIRNKVIQLFLHYKIDLIPYHKNIELTIIASSFIEQNEKNLIFRIYVPSERIWANEAEKLLKLFREYLDRVSGLNVSLNQYATNQGIVYEFFSGDEVAPSILPDHFNEFSSFMDSCSSNPDNAKILLESKNLSKQEVFNLIEKYTKEARRLRIDLKQERERKILNIKHNLESELAEYARTKEDWVIIDQIVDSNVPKINGVSSAISIDQKSLLNDSQNLTINIQPQIIETINGVVAQQIIGDQHLGQDTRQLLEIIDKYGEEKKAELASAAHELNDDNAKDSDRIIAKYKLKGFILKVASKIGNVSFDLVMKYIENIFGL
jgi:hypothetical protein